MGSAASKAKRGTAGRAGGDDRAAPPRLAQTAATIERALEADLSAWLGDVPARLGEAVRYALMGPGKRLRPALLIWSAEAAGAAAEQAVPAAVAIEMLHTYSLVHDDLPAMDDDDLRRGRPTCHKAFDEATAILAGDALLTRAFGVLGEAELPADRVAGLVRVLADAGGAAGMIGGQAEDLAHEGRGGDLSAVQYIHQHKTAALVSAACRMGAIVAGAGRTVQETLARFGLCLGMAFQIADDLLDETGRTEHLGKKAGKDRTAGKLTCVAVVGVDASRLEARRWIDQADAALADLDGLDADRVADLRAIGRYFIERTR